MHIIVCLDENGGMLFNHRRQSRDRVLTESILRDAGGGQLFMNGYSSALFSEKSYVSVHEDFLRLAAEGEHCFVENTPAAPYIRSIESIIVYRWDRKYPADTYFDIPLSAWRLTERREFAGSSHEKLTREVYTR